MNDGTMHVESIVGKGTTFIVSWKIAEQSDPVETRLNEDKVKFSIVDDSEDNHNLLNIYLKGKGWEIGNALSGHEATRNF